MLEYPELYVISEQMKQVLIGKTVNDGKLVKHNNNLFMDMKEAEKYALLSGGKVTSIELFAPEIYISLDNGYGILFCQCGGKIQYYGDAAPGNSTISFCFDDGSVLSYTMKLWSMGVYAISHDEWEFRKQQNGTRQFQPKGSLADYLAFVEQNREQGKRPVKTFLAKFISGVMSAFAAEILLYAKIHPSKALGKLSNEEHERLYNAMRMVLVNACEKGGRVTEVDLFGAKGGYRTSAERKNIGGICPVCGNTLEKVSVGGVTAYCPVCQAK